MGVGGAGVSWALRPSGVSYPGGVVLSFATSAAATALMREPNGLALSFTDDYFHASTSHYGSARVKDTSTPANNYNSHPFGLLTYASPSLKMCRGPDGNLRYGAHNLCLQSENFTTTWLNINTTEQEVFDVAPPAGYARVWEVTDDAVTGRHIIYQTSTTEIVGLPHEFSVCMKRGTNRYGVVSIDFNGNKGTCVVDLETGVLTEEVETSGSATFNSEHLDDGWYRVSVRGTPTSTNTFIIIGLSDVASGGTYTASQPSYSGTGKSIYVTGAHKRVLPSDDTYLKTTSAARYELPYEWDAAGNPLGIRVEGQRTNLFLNNRSPATQNITVTAQAYTLSFYGTGSITLSGAHEDELQGTGEDERVELTFTPSAGTLTCTVGGDIDFVQLEAGSYPTSPIVTAGSTVTRAADNISLSTSKFPLGASHTIFAEHLKDVSANESNRGVVKLNDGSSSNRIDIRSGGAASHVTSGGVGQAQAVANMTSDGVTYRSVWAVAANDAAFYKNGTQVSTDDTVTVPTGLTVLGIGQLDAGANNPLNGWIKRVVYLPRRMSNAELQELTAP